MYFHSGEPWECIFNDHWKISIVKHSFLDFDFMLSLQAQIQIHNSGHQQYKLQLLTEPEWFEPAVIRMYRIWGVVNMHESDWGALIRLWDFQLIMVSDQFYKTDHKAIDIQMMYLQQHLLMSADNHELQSLLSILWQKWSTAHQIVLANDSSWIQVPPWDVVLHSE